MNVHTPPKRTYDQWPDHFGLALISIVVAGLGSMTLLSDLAELCRTVFNDSHKLDLDNISDYFFIGFFWLLPNGAMAWHRRTRRTQSAEEPAPGI